MIKRAILASLFVVSSTAAAQQGYEFEVYGADIPKVGATELEVHSNFVLSGSSQDSPEIRTSHRALRSSIELTRALNSWLAASLYEITYARSGDGVEQVGNRARLTAIAPAKWNLPFEAGMSHEIGFASPGFAENRWSYELTPIIGKDFGGFSLLLNPALEVGLSEGSHEWELEPRAKLARKLGDDEGFGLEYYSVLGPVNGFDSRSHQIHQLFATASGEIAGLEASLGLGRGFTTGSDRWVLSSRFEIEF